MKKSLIATLLAVPLLSLSSMAFAAEPVLLSASQMDDVTAGALFSPGWLNLNIAPAVVTQLNLFSSNTANIAEIANGLTVTN